MSKWLRVAMAGLALALVVPLGTSMAFGARGGGEEQGLTTAKGLCTDGTTTWDMEMARDSGIEFEVGVDSGVPDQEWHVVVRYNQHVEIDTIEMTEDEGDFDIRKVENNARGKDTIQIRAEDVDDGVVCIGEMTSEI